MTSIAFLRHLSKALGCEPPEDVDVEGPLDELEDEEELAIRPVIGQQRRSLKESRSHEIDRSPDQETLSSESLSLSRP